MEVKPPSNMAEQEVSPAESRAKSSKKARISKISFQCFTKKSVVFFAPLAASFAVFLAAFAVFPAAPAVFCFARKSFA